MNKNYKQKLPERQNINVDNESFNVNYKIDQGIRNDIAEFEKGLFNWNVNEDILGNVEGDVNGDVNGDISGNVEGVINGIDGDISKNEVHYYIDGNTTIKINGNTTVNVSWDRD